MANEYDQRVIVYPNYINSKKTVAEGRRIPKPKACEHPTPMEMLDCCKYLKIPTDVEDKCYSRDWLNRGRLRVQLYKEGTREPVNPEIPNRRTLLLKIAELVPKHPGRSKKNQAQAPKPETASGSSAAASIKSGGKNNKKKKGK